MLIADGKELNDFSEDAAAIGINQARDDLVGNVSGRRAQHLLKLRGREPLNDDILLCFLRLVLSLEVQRVVLFTLL